jgi:hypothetical protein
VISHSEIGKELTLEVQRVVKANGVFWKLRRDS